MSAENPVATWDFTLFEEYCERSVLLAWIKENCKKWCFQLERGERTSKLHFQGRVSLKVKTRKPDKVVKEIRWSPTSNSESKNDFYVCKEETRVEGPWKDTDKEIYIPRQIKEITTLYPWQQKVLGMSQVWDRRCINILIDPKGNRGKTILITYMCVYEIAKILPFCNDYQDIMRMAYGVGTSPCYLIDMPRAINKERLLQLFAAIETLKGGYCYDDRYSFKSRWFDTPNIWVFTNKIPDLDYLSFDRWKFWGIDSKLELFEHTKFYDSEMWGKPKINKNHEIVFDS